MLCPNGFFCIFANVFEKKPKRHSSQFLAKSFPKRETFEKQKHEKFSEKVNF